MCNNNKQIEIMATKKQREFWKHNINPITGLYFNKYEEAEYLRAKDDSYLDLLEEEEPMYELDLTPALEWI